MTTTTSPTTTTLPSPLATAPRPASTAVLREKALVAALVLAAFGAYSVWVILGHGYTGFLTLANREPWAMQLLLDLVIALAFTLGWLRGDARKHGLPAWPFYLGAVFLGSISILTYVVARGAVARTRAA